MRRGATVTDARLDGRHRGSGWRTVRRVMPYLWPVGQAWVKRRVLLSLAMLLVAKLVAVGTPFFYKAAVDALSGEGSADAAWTLGAGAVGLTVAYGMARVLNIGLQSCAT
jgi:ATP-binding cassette subfamily B protein